MSEVLGKIKSLIKYLIDFVWIILLILSVLISYQALTGFDNFNCKFVFLPLIPVILFFIKIKFTKYIKNSIAQLIMNIAGCVFLVLFLLFIEIEILLTLPYTTTEPSIKQYKNSLLAFQKSYWQCDLSYFPDEIPQDATDYYFYIGTDFHGYNVYYLKFNIDETYVKNLIKKYKDDILEIGTKDVLYKKGLDIRINDLNNNFQIYLLKQHCMNSCERCKSGFVINENDINKSVYFFFQNF